MKNRGCEIFVAVCVLVIPVIIIVMVAGSVSCSKSSSSSTSSGSSSIDKPTSLTATYNSATGNITVGWTDNSDNETSFCLYYRAYDATTWTLGTSAIPEDATTYSFPSDELDDNGSGNFQLCMTAYDSDNDVESEASNIVTISW